MNLFFLVSASAFSAIFAAILLAVAIWTELAVHFKSIRRRIVRGFEPLADATRLDKAALRLNHATLRFESEDGLVAGRI